MGVPSRFLALAILAFWSSLRLLFIALIGLAAIFPAQAFGQSQPTLTENEVWPEVDAHVQLPSDFRILALSGFEQGVGYPFQQWYVGAGIGRQLKTISKLHWKNIDPDKEHYLVAGVGYEFLHTKEPAAKFEENRVTFDVTGNVRPASWLLLRDRNWVELRWIAGTYSTTYRNLVSAEVDVHFHNFHFTPFGSTEFFYDSPKHAWDQTWYTGGVQVPYKRVFMVEMYYRREQCSTCTPQNWNAGGITLHFFLNNSKD